MAGGLTRRDAVAVLGVLALAALAWLLGPHLPWGDAHPFAGPWPRAGLAAAIAATGLGILAWRRWRLQRRLAALRKAAGAGASFAPAPEPAPMEVDELRLILAEAVEWTRARSRRPNRLGEQAYALPWVLVAGAPGSGRSSLVARTDFPTPPQPRPAGSGTWWLAEEAVLIEAPGHWFAQGADATLLLQLLGRLSAVRPRRPLDAILLTVGAEALIADPRAAAVGLRARLQQIMRGLRAAPPVVVAVTMCDRIPGFTGALGRLEGTERTIAVPLGGQGDPAPNLRPALAEFVAAAGRRLPFDLAAERDPVRRATLLDWPGQAARLADAAEQFVRELARTAPGDWRPDLRALHLTAAGGTATGASDPWAAGFAATFGLDRPPPPPVSEAPLLVDGLIRGHLLSIAGSGGSNIAEERRTTLRHVAGYAASVGLLAVLAGIWATAYAMHDHILDDLEARIGALDRLEDAATTPPVTADRILDLLEVAHSMAALRAEELPGAGFLALAMPRPTPDLSAARRVYDVELRAYLLPFLRERLAQQIAAENDLARLRDLLRIYLASASPRHYDAAAFRSWANATMAALLSLDPAGRQMAQAHIARLVQLLPEPNGLDAAVVAGARERLRQRPEAEVVYNELRRQAERSAEAPPLDVVGSLGVAAAQLLMLRHQAGLPVVVPGLYTRAGFFSVFLPRLPALLQGDADEAFLLGSEQDVTGRQALLRRVTELYTNDYIRQWRAVLDQTALRALPDLPSLVGGVQALSGADSPLLGFIELVRQNTDLQPPSEEAAGLLGRAAGTVGGAAVQQAVTGAVAAASSTALSNLARDWPGSPIRAAFLPIITLAGRADSMQASTRLQGPLATAFGTLSGISGSANPQQAAHQVAAAGIGPQGNDPFAAIRTQAATLPRPLDGIFRDLHSNIWNVLLGLAMERINIAWNLEVAPACAQAISRRYPFAGRDAPADRDVLPRDFAAFFGPNGTLDRWVTTYLLPFTQSAADGTLVPASRGGLRLDLSREALAQVNRARAFRDLFFDSAGNLSVRLTLMASYLDPRALSASLSSGPARMVYRHEPPRPFEFRWPAPDDAGGASLQLSMTDGTVRQLQASGPWALFRLLDQAERSGMSDRVTVRFRLGDAQVAYSLRGASATNPFSMRDWMEFRCIPRL